ncbi:MAG TPA: antibiotic biosynthesis monooxygenase [Pseudoxanthomonas sp.]
MASPSPKKRKRTSPSCARAVPDYRATPGNLSMDVLHRTTGTITHYLIVTHWESQEAIEAFAGVDADVARAKYYREDVDFLLEFEPTVEHYEVAT